MDVVVVLTVVEYKKKNKKNKEQGKKKNRTGLFEVYGNRVYSFVEKDIFSITG